MPPQLYSAVHPDVKNADCHFKNNFKWVWMDE